MSLYKDTKLGKITISDKIITNAVMHISKKEKYNEIIWLSTPKGKLLSDDDWFQSNDSVKNIEIDYNGHDDFRLKYYVIVKFGESIKTVLNHLNQEILQFIYEKTSVIPNEICTVVTGVKSENISHRYMEFKFSYETK